MRSIVLDPSFAAWRAATRTLLMERVHPRDVDWRESDTSATVFGTVAQQPVRRRFGRAQAAEDRQQLPQDAGDDCLLPLSGPLAVSLPRAMALDARRPRRGDRNRRRQAAPAPDDRHRACRGEHMRQVLRFRHRGSSLGPPEFIS